MTRRNVIITSSVLVGIIAIITILFGAVFRVREIQVKCDDGFYYHDQLDDILSVSQLKKNTSIFALDNDKMITNIEQNDPYAKVNSISLTSFTSVDIKLSNRIALYYFIENEICYILDEDCKVLEKITIQEYNNRDYNLIELQNVFSAGEGVGAGQFLDGKYAVILGQLFKDLYTNAMVEIDNGGQFEAKYLEREDMCNIISNVAFTYEYEIYGKVDRLVMSTSYGLKITIIEPQKDLDKKVNQAFSAFRVLQARDREQGENFTQTGAINVIYSYDEVGNCSIVCEYRA